MGMIKDLSEVVIAIVGAAVNVDGASECVPAFELAGGENIEFDSY